MITRAIQRNIHISSFKAKLVCDLIRGKKVKTAIAMLNNQPQKTAYFLLKLLTSAIANATNNHSMIGKDLYIYAIAANQGRTLKRPLIRARGRTDVMKKRHVHLVIELSDDVNERKEKNKVLLKPRAHQYKYKKQISNLELKKKIHTSKEA